MVEPTQDVNARAVDGMSRRPRFGSDGALGGVGQTGSSGEDKPSGAARGAAGSNSAKPLRTLEDQKKPTQPGKAKDGTPTWGSLAKSSLGAGVGASAPRAAPIAPSGQPKTGARTGLSGSVAGGAGISPQEIKDIASRIKEHKRPLTADEAITLLQEFFPEFVIPIRIGLKLLRIPETDVIDAVWGPDDPAPGMRSWKVWSLVAKIIFRLLLLVIVTQIVIWGSLLIFLIVILLSLCKFINQIPFNSVLFPVISPICNQLNQAVGTLTGSFGGDAPSYVPTPVAGRRCASVTDPASYCNQDRLAAACSWDPVVASRICSAESGGGYNPAVGGQADKCNVGGQSLPMSIGIFQINIFNSYSPEFPECRNVLRQTGCESYERTSGGVRYCAKRLCEFGPSGRAGYDRCVAALSDPVRNTRQACNLYRERGWQPWTAAKDCRILQ
jgi:hypothetical protein